MPGVNSFVTRAIKKMVTSTKQEGNEVKLFIVGEKGRSQLARIYADVSSKATMSATMSAAVWCIPFHCLVVV